MEIQETEYGNINRPTVGGLSLPEQKNPEHELMDIHCGKEIFTYSKKHLTGFARGPNKDFETYIGMVELPASILPAWLLFDEFLEIGEVNSSDLKVACQAILMGQLIGSTTQFEELLGEIIQKQIDSRELADLIPYVWSHTCRFHYLREVIVTGLVDAGIEPCFCHGDGFPQPEHADFMLDLDQAQTLGAINYIEWSEEQVFARNLNRLKIFGLEEI